MSTHWYKGKQYETHPESKKGTCKGCAFDKPPEVCFVNIWSDRRERQVVCGDKPVIFKLKAHTN